MPVVSHIALGIALHHDTHIEAAIAMLQQMNPLLHQISFFCSDMLQSFKQAIKRSKRMNARAALESKALISEKLLYSDDPVAK